MSRILLVEDEHALGNAMELAVRRLGHLPLLAASGGAALERFSQLQVDAVVLDIGLPDMSGLEVLDRIRAGGSSVPVLIVTAHATLDHAIASQKLGIADYLVKPLDLSRFEHAVSALVARGGLVARPVEHAAPTLIGAAPRMREVFLAMARACAGELPVLIHGPSGSGKSLAARVIHANSRRGSGPLRETGCAGPVDSSAFRQALAQPEGTLILEDIERLPGPEQTIVADAIARAERMLPRLVATMTVEPRAAVEAGLLRADLYYAFSPVTIAMPALADRTGDIPALGSFFCGLNDGSNAGMELTPQALGAMQAYSWPGNVRELRHVLEHARAMSRGGPVFPGHLPPHVAASVSPGEGTRASGELLAAVSWWLDSRMQMMPEDEWSYDTLLDGIEAAMLSHLLGRFGDRPTHLARAMRMNRATLRQKLRRLEPCLPPGAGDG